MMLVGSHALRHHGIDVGRPIVDYDWITTYDNFKQSLNEAPDFIYCRPLSDNKFVVQYDHQHIHHKQTTMWEYEIAWEGSSAADLLEMYPDMCEATPEICLTLKMSHRYLKNSPHFRKTMDDIWLLRRNGIKVPEQLKQWLVKREKETYNYKHPSLMQSKGKFFTDDVKYFYDHDTVHLAVMHLVKPAYEYFKQDNQEVFCSKDKFFSVDYYVRLCAVLEESYVLAIERSLVPFPGALTPKQAFDRALMKVCTSITSGWFREYAWEHYHDVQALYNDKYFDKFQHGVSIGLVKKL